MNSFNFTEDEISNMTLRAIKKFDTIAIKLEDTNLYESQKKSVS